MKFLLKRKVQISQSQIIALVAVLIVLLTSSCEYDTIKPISPPPPPTAEETENLVAEYVSSLPVSVNDAHWLTSKYTVVNVEDIEKGNLYEDGYLNMTGTHDGISSFNGGDDPEVILRAAYNDSNICVLIEWADSDKDASYGSLLWNGPEDTRKDDSASGWTSQRNSDNISLTFNLPTPSDSVVKDKWQWSLSYSEPLGYAVDKFETEDGTSYPDAGKSMMIRNTADPDNSRSVPQYEWNGEVQNITKADGTETILDPAFYLLESNTIPVVGNIEDGNAVYNSSKSKCTDCHGVHGEGAAFAGINSPGVMNRKSRVLMEEILGSPEGHTGSTHFNKLSSTEIENLMIRLRGMAGVPGYLLTNPNGSSADITASSQIVLANISQSNSSKYKVLITRKLQTGNSDDIQFDPENISEYVFDIALSDNDEINYIGSVNQVLTFE